MMDNGGLMEDETFNNEEGECFEGVIEGWNGIDG